MSCLYTLRLLPRCKLAVRQFRVLDIIQHFLCLLLAGWKNNPEPPSALRRLCILWVLGLALSPGALSLHRA